MPDHGGDNFERLKEEGFIGEDPLPTQYLRVVEGLTDDEVDVLIAVRRRLLAVDEVADAPPVGPGETEMFYSKVKF